MKRAWLIESTLFLLYFAFGISWLAYSPLMPEIEKQFGIEHAQAGSIISAVSLAKAFVPLLIGISGGSHRGWTQYPGRSHLVLAQLAGARPFRLQGATCCAILFRGRGRNSGDPDGVDGDEVFFPRSAAFD